MCLISFGIFVFNSYICNNHNNLRVMFKAIYVKNFRRGLATNSSSTHSIIYKNPGDLFEDLGVFENDYFDRFTRNIAATREAKIKYIFHCIWRNERLVEKMAVFYPEMKQYFPLAKKGFESEEYDTFGEHSRGNFVGMQDECGQDPDFPVDYLRYIIDTENVVIVGGSDEEDFVYDMRNGHLDLPVSGDVWDWDYPYKKNGITRNGNYYVAYGETYEGKNEDGEPYPEMLNSTGGRLRFMTEDTDPVPEYPELIDLRITNRCDHGCKFCFMNSGINEKDADINELMSFINELRTKTEFSIGGGNVLLYPELEKLFEHIDERGHIINVTVNVKDCNTILNNKRFKRIFAKYVDGIGVSVFSESDLDKFFEFKAAFEKIENRNDRGGFNRKYIVAHTVPEYVGMAEMTKILKRIEDSKTWAPVLFLGYKENGRGANCEYHKFTEGDIKELFKDSWSISIDTMFAKRYGDFIKKIYSTRYCLTENEGEYSMYVDGITMNAYKSSYETDKPYHIGHKDVHWKDKINAAEAFAKIREDNGFPVYSPTHYWDK